MDITEMLVAFERLCVAHVMSLRAVPEQLRIDGFTETQSRLIVDDDSIQSLCWEHPTLPYGISYLQDRDGFVSSCAIMIPDQPGLKKSLIAYVEQQENAKEITDEAMRFMAFTPAAVAPTLIAGRFWTAKPHGEAGRNFSVTAALFKLRGSTEALALSVEHNASLRDEMTAEEWQGLIGPDSKLQQCVDIFHKTALAHAPDIAAIDAAAQALGFRGEDMGNGAMAYAGGPGHGTTSISINCDTEFDFEFALSFILDERIPADLVRQRLFESVGLGAAKPGHWFNYDGAWGEIDLRAETFRISGYCESQIFGNHHFFLQK